MKIMGIDPSLTGTGVCILETPNTIIFDKEIITKDKNTERLITISRELKTILTLYIPELICLEGYAYANPNQAHQLGELGGIIRILLHEYNYKKRNNNLKIIQPTTLKKFITSKGNCKKELILKEVYKQFNYDTDSNNIADAFALTMVGLPILVPEEYEKLTKVRKEVINKILEEKENVRSRKPRRRKKQ